MQVLLERQVFGGTGSVMPKTTFRQRGEEKVLIIYSIEFWDKVWKGGHLWQKEEAPSPWRLNMIEGTMSRRAKSEKWWASGWPSGCLTTSCSRLWFQVEHAAWLLSEEAFMKAKGPLFILSIMLCSINANGVWEAKSSHIAFTEKFTLQDLSGKVTEASTLGETHKSASWRQLGITLVWLCPDVGLPLFQGIILTLGSCFPSICLYGKLPLHPLWEETLSHHPLVSVSASFKQRNTMW